MAARGDAARTQIEEEREGERSRKRERGERVSARETEQNRRKESALNPFLVLLIHSKSCSFKSMPISSSF